MNIDKTKKRPPVGTALSEIEDWRRRKIKAELKAVGFTEGQWKGLLANAEGYKVPAFVRDIIVKELPETAHLFNHPQLKAEAV
ncbi:hypothetical protein SAMN05216327_101234 [Dyadobacter sp. SG02]|uniref:hypothetical protein n=1 Tax=Dyadobacter sp. SG02 TaxID=1855291 RepID=UPI0008BECCA5|nr:hypothetical protein [Dyadobacter sp. SG02]SEI39859.1 hypothetical protein SAMN05216327_101234 [Dyadobacter sp. SG02]